jgi:dTDP-4-dehydrorhamnose reductase
MSKPLAWITGAGGLIGHDLVMAAPEQAPGYRVIGLTRQDLDLLDFKAIERRFKAERPELIIHCAALSRSPDCQANPGLARQLNVELTSFLAQLGSESSFVFFSSDLVFDGRVGNYTEASPPNPLSVYAQTKVEAEKVVLANSKHTVVRTSLNGGQSPSGDRGFNEQMRKACEAGKTLTLFVDEFRCPIAASVTARAVWELIRNERPGLYHLAGAERLSRLRIGQLLAARWTDLACKIVPGSSADYPGAPRSTDPSLDCRKIQKLLSFPLPGLSQWLETHPDDKF